ncbi:hypothetical protein Y032_0154g2994 [Ancylostoma ceylanicum]|uniref:Peptidase C1A papain C-terminal domain-containing protein n=1 Tax=Ancylostoma ceylanicum TaxID=53326 RepID=A0A016T0B5_9BILA|nr:hypothetical protein Y032_0154g2994 [Ancylostoma ceylanicum]
MVGDERDKQGAYPVTVLIFLISRSFDARTYWPECKSIRMIRDQSECGSCWAVSSASAMSDELCVQSNGTIKLTLSDTDLLACCDDCGGCFGGWPSKAYKWAERAGVVTGGKYRQKVMFRITAATLSRLNYSDDLK